jgi:hypothetical protein
VVSQVPTISGWQTTLRRTPPPALASRRREHSADRLERFRGGVPKTVPMVADPAEGGPASHASADAWEFFTGKNAPPEDQWRFRKWRDELTLRSLEMYSEYEPGSFIERIGPTPLLMIVGDRTSSARRISHSTRSTAAVSPSGSSCTRAVTSPPTPINSSARPARRPTGSPSTCDRPAKTAPSQRGDFEKMCHRWKFAGLWHATLTGMA